MTPGSFNLALHKLQLTQVGFAKVIKRNPRTIRHWAAGSAEVPTEIAMLLNLMLSTKTQPEKLKS